MTYPTTPPSQAEEFGFEVARFTSDEGVPPWPVLTTRRGCIRLDPVIVPGKSEGGYRGPDLFRNFEMTLTVSWYRAPFLARLLKRRLAFEMWTKDSRGGFIHWLFPYTSWHRTSWRTFSGVTQSGPEVVPADIPDGRGITDAAAWKVDSLP